MQVVIPQLALSRELALLAPAADRKATIPILGNVRIVADGDGVTLTATDLEHALVSRVPCAVGEPGAICLPAKRLLDFVRSLAGESVDIAVGPNNHATVKCGKARARIPGESAASFPEFPQAPAPLLTMDARKLAAQFARVAFAVIDTEAQNVVRGLLLDIKDGAVSTVAIDGHRLAFTSSDAPTGVSASLIVPKVAVAAYAKMADIAEGGAVVSVGQDENHLFFAVDGRSLMVRKIAGNFFQYERLLRADYSPNVFVATAELKTAIDGVRQFGEVRTKGGVSRTVALALSPGEITVSAAAFDVGECENTIGCEYTGEPLRAAYDPQYIADFLSAAGSDRIEMCLRDARSAVEMRPVGDVTYRYVCMGKRI